MTPRSEHWSVWGLENGLTSLTEALKDKLLKLGVEIFMDYKVQDLYFRLDQKCQNKIYKGLFPANLNFLIPIFLQPEGLNPLIFQT